MFHNSIALCPKKKHLSKLPNPNCIVIKYCGATIQMLDAYSSSSSLETTQPKFQMPPYYNSKVTYLTNYYRKEKHCFSFVVDIYHNSPLLTENGVSPLRYKQIRYTPIPKYIGRKITTNTPTNQTPPTPEAKLQCH